MKIGSVTVEPAVMNAACSIAKNKSDVKKLANTSIGAILIGSVTILPRKGNNGLKWLTNDSYSINSFGMPNKGYHYYKKHLPEFTKIAHTHNKKFVLSIAGFSVNEYKQLAGLANNTGVDLLELNLGCPNISIKGQQKPIFSFDPTMIEKIVKTVRGVTAVPILLKLSPYSNPEELGKVAKTISKLPVSAVVTSNTFPNSSMGAIRSTHTTKLAGFGGRALQPIALGQVQQFRKLLPSHIKIIGVGGIETKSDRELYQKAGADGVQAATLIVRDGHKAIDQVAS